MPGKQAKILSEDNLQDLLVYASATRNPIRNRVIVPLSAKGGLRAGEIANLTWGMILEPNGAISTAIELRDHAAKKRSGRSARLLPFAKFFVLPGEKSNNAYAACARPTFSRGLRSISLRSHRTREDLALGAAACRPSIYSNNPTIR
jgi:integrase